MSVCLDFLIWKTEIIKVPIFQAFWKDKLRYLGQGTMPVYSKHAMKGKDVSHYSC
jgi:hypothetical protein